MKPGSFKIPLSDVLFDSTTDMTVTADVFTGFEEDTRAAVGDTRTLAIMDISIMGTAARSADTRNKVTL